MPTATATRRKLVEEIGGVLRQINANPYIPHEPTLKQAAFLTLWQREALFGGAAGGGKSDALLMLALQYKHVPKHASLILRRTYRELALPEGLIPRSAEWLAGTAANWSGDAKTWTFPSGATLTFGYLETPQSHTRYQSSAFQDIDFDELTHFHEHQYRYMFSRLRRTKELSAIADVPLRMRSGTNPGGVGHEWVKTRFGLGDTAAQSTNVSRSKRAFLASMLADNPFLDRDEYAETLAELDPVTRAQLLDGDWTARVSGGYFKREWFKVHDRVPDDVRLEASVRFWDFASTDPELVGGDPDWTAGALMSIDSDGEYWLTDMRQLRGTPRDVRELVRGTAQADGQRVIVVIEEEPGASGKTVTDLYQRDVLPEFAVKPFRPTGSKVDRARPFSSKAEAGLIHVVRGGWLLPFYDQAEGFPTVEYHDDFVDAASGAFNELVKMRQSGGVL